MTFCTKIDAYSYLGREGRKYHKIVKDQKWSFDRSTGEYFRESCYTIVWTGGKKHVDWS